MYLHYFIGAAQQLAPFTQRLDLLLTLPRFAGNINAVTLLMTTMSSSAGAFEFLSKWSRNPHHSFDPR